MRLNIRSIRLNLARAWTRTWKIAPGSNLCLCCQVLYSMETLCVESVLRGYHIYKDLPWEPAIGTTLTCEREAYNIHDPYAVAVMNHGVVAGHVPRFISAVCSMFLRRGGEISCEITGRRQYSSDLPQGGLELPRKLKFSAASNEITKIRNLLMQAPKSDEFPLSITNSNTSANTTKLATSIEVKSRCDSVIEPIIISSSSIMKGEALQLTTPEPEENITSDVEPTPKKPRTSDNSAETVWLKLEKNVLTWYDKEVISNHMELNDRHINYRQCLLKKQFPLVGGLLLTLLQNKPMKQKIVCGLQIIHCKERNHWIVASRLDSRHSPVKIYDSLYKSINKETATIVQNMFKKIGKVKIEIADMQVQKGSADCGLFAIAIATSLLYDINLSYNQDKMRDHLLYCLEHGSLSVFPSQ